MKTFQNWPNELHSISGSEKFVSLHFPLFSDNCWNNQNQETHPVWSLPIFLCSFKIFQYSIFWCKSISCMGCDTLLLRKNIFVAIWDFKDLTGYFTVFMNYIEALRFARKTL